MSKPLIPLTIGSPGFYGLNTQDAGSILPPGWATKAENCVFDDAGRLASRRGSQQLNGTAVTSSPTIKSCIEHVDDAGNKVVIFAADNKIWKEVSGTMTDVSGTITTPTGDDWQFANFNGWVVGFQEGHNPIISTSATTPAFADIANGQDGSMVCSAYGRMWTVYQNSLYYSDLLVADFTSGSSGSFDLSEYWPDGMDEAVAIKDYEGLLVVFGKRSMIVYENADDVTNMNIYKTVGGVGCPYRDSVQNVGDDLIFMSYSGLRSFRSSIRELGGARLTDISQHVRDKLVAKISSETPVEVKSAYNERLGFYLLSLPTAGISYYFDRRFPNPDESWRITTWDIAPTALYYAQDTTMYMALTDGYLSYYTGYNDEHDVNGSGGTSYVLNFEGVWNDFGEEVGNYVKLMKSLSVLASGVAGGVVVFKWAVDYGQLFETINLNFTTNPPAGYGVAQYGIDSYAASGDFERIRSTLSRSGQVIKPGLRARIDGFEFSLQRIDILAKVGKLGL